MKKWNTEAVSKMYNLELRNVTRSHFIVKAASSLGDRQGRSQEFDLGGYKC